MCVIRIFQGKYSNDYFWIDFFDEHDDEFKTEGAEYFVNSGYNCGYHVSEKSALYDDMEGFVDDVQCEEGLDDGELYVVTYFEFDDGNFLNQRVDFGITKSEIIRNVKAQRYIEGATYHTFGQMFYATRKMMESMND